MNDKFNNYYSKIDTIDNIELASEASENNKNKSLISTVIFIIVLLIVLIFTKDLDSNIFFRILFTLVTTTIITTIISIILLSILFSKKNKSINDKATANIIIPLIKEFYEDAQYNRYSSMSEYDYNHSMYNEHYDRYTSNNLIKSQKYKLTLSQVHTENRHTDKDGHTTYTTIFKGLVCKKNISKVIPSTLKVLRNLSGLLNKNRVTMDMKDFEKYFDVICDNKILTMRILTSDILLDITNKINEMDGRFEFAIDKDNLYIRISYYNNIFSKVFNKGKLDKISLYEYYNLLNNMNNLINYIDTLIKEFEV